MLLEEFYKTDIQLEKYHDRKIAIADKSYQINGISQSGKTYLIKNYLLSVKKNSYLYIDCDDIRIDIEKLNQTLSSFLNKNKIMLLVLDNYRESIRLVNVSQLILSSQEHLAYDFLETLQLFPLDYEEFLAYEQKYDASALNHFLQIGGLPIIQKVAHDEKNVFLQNILKKSLNDIAFDIMVFCAKHVSQKISAFSIYERLKQTRKISKDKLYTSFERLQKNNYIHLLGKFNYPKATKKIYLCDIAFKSALSVEKNFGKLFENMIYLELRKADITCYYEDDIDFYLPQSDEIILCKPFADERRLFQKLESIEAFLFTHSIKKVTAITMSKEGSISHPLSKVEMLPFDIWALGD